TPTTVTSGFLLFLFLTLFSIEVEEDKKLFQFYFAERFRSIPYFLLGASLLFGGVVFYGVKGGYLAERAYVKSLDAVASDNLVSAYNELQEAIAKNPYLDDYHRAYAQVNLGIINGLSQKEDLTDDDKTTIQALINQVVREARILTENLSPSDSRNWALRGQIYRGLVGSAQDAETWAIGAYQQAVFLDPLNLYLRVNLGGIYYQLEDYDTAERIFRAAAQLKPDFANARFNLAAALREQGKIDEARKELEATKSLVEQDSLDAQRVEEELEKLK
ncbi:MAG: tetratricopeptide repeat protein, partial [Candidatus Cloacimonetes bacterium]|nr:tetratricopeptide repeat protein [Candidatus Cloacimonadota bacterium]